MAPWPLTSTLQGSEKIHFWCPSHLVHGILLCKTRITNMSFCSFLGKSLLSAATTPWNDAGRMDDIPKCLLQVVMVIKTQRDFPGDLNGKESACNVGEQGFVPGLGRSPGEGTGNPLQYSCLEKPTNRGAWRTIVHGVAKSRTRLSD